MENNDSYSLLLLAGGKSSRMGASKADLPYGDKTFLEHMLDKAHALNIEKCFISGYPSKRRDVQAVPDQFPDRGPLGGLHAGMKAMDTPYCLVLPIDAPLLPLHVLESLLCFHREHAKSDRVLIWEHGDRKEPLIAVYPVAMANTIEELISNHPAPVFRALDRFGYECYRMEIDEAEIINVNTKELYEEILKKGNGTQP